MNERIKKLRKALDLTQQAFSERIGIKRNTLANYEINRNEPSNSVISLICREFNVNEDWLRNGQGEMFKVTSDSTLDALAAEYDLSSNDCILIGKFLGLKASERQAVIRYMQEVVTAINANNLADVSEISDVSPTDAEIEYELESYRQELLAERLGNAVSSASEKQKDDSKLA